MLKHNQMAARAQAIATEAHAGQVDKAGRPYIEHVARVAKRFHKDTDAHILAVAWLHDVLEDCPEWTADRLRQEGFCEAVVAGVVAITKLPEEHGDDNFHADYVARLRDDELAYNVKISDLLDNLDISRLEPEQIDVKVQRRVRNYLKTLGQLLAQLHEDNARALESVSRARVVGVALGPDGEIKPFDSGPTKKESVH